MPSDESYDSMRRYAAENQPMNRSPGTVYSSGPHVNKDSTHAYLNLRQPGDARRQTQKMVLPPHPTHDVLDSIQQYEFQESSNFNLPKQCAIESKELRRLMPESSKPMTNYNPQGSHKPKMVPSSPKHPDVGHRITDGNDISLGQVKMHAQFILV